MRVREAGALAHDIIARTRDTFEDHESWFGDLSRDAAVGYAGGSGGGRGSTHADPTVSAAMGHDPVRAELREHEEDLKQLLKLLAKFEKRRVWVRAKGLRSTVPGPIICENVACGEKISGRDSDVQRDGLCPKCYQHRRRHNLPWPKRYMTPEEAARMVGQ